MLGDDLFHISSRAVDRNETFIADPLAQIVNLERVGVDNDQCRIAAQPLQHKTAKRADPGTIFDKQIAIAQSTGASILRTVKREEGMIEPTICGYSTNPRKNTAHCAAYWEKRSVKRRLISMALVVMRWESRSASTRWGDG